MICFNIPSNFILISQKQCKKNEVLLYANLVTPRQGQGQSKWSKMVEVNGAYELGRYEQICHSSLHEMSNVKVLATQDGQMNTTHYTDPYNTNMDQQEG